MAKGKKRRRVAGTETISHAPAFAGASMFRGEGPRRFVARVLKPIAEREYLLDMDTQRNTKAEDARLAELRDRLGRASKKLAADLRKEIADAESEIQRRIRSEREHARAARWGEVELWWEPPDPFRLQALMAGEEKYFMRAQGWVSRMISELSQDDSVNQDALARVIEGRATLEVLTLVDVQIQAALVTPRVIEVENGAAPNYEAGEILFSDLAKIHPVDRLKLVALITEESGLAELFPERPDTRLERVPDGKAGALPAERPAGVSRSDGAVGF